MGLLSVHQGLGRKHHMGAEVAELSDEPVNLPLSVGELRSSVTCTARASRADDDQPTLGAMRRLSISSRLFAASSS
jgi:hypothetical protein